MIPSLTTLLIDSGLSARNAMITRISQVHGVSVLGSADPAHALESVRSLQPQLVVYDVKRDDGDPTPLVRALRRLPHSPDIIIHTSFVIAEEARLLHEAGATAIVLREAGLRSLTLRIDNVRSRIIAAMALTDGASP